LRIRFMTSHPKDANAELFKAMKRLDKVCEHIHLPLQSGSDRILELMNRRYSAMRYKKMTDSLRQIMPGCAITTDIITGFPSETEEDFKDTYMLVKEIGFDDAFIFKYSPRPFTKASEMKDDVPKEVKEERHSVLLALQARITKTMCEKMQGHTQKVLGVGIARRKPEGEYLDNQKDFLKGRTRTNYQVVYRADKTLIGKEVSVKIKNISSHTLIGEAV